MNFGRHRQRGAHRRAMVASLVLLVAHTAARAELTLRSGDVLLALEQNGVSSVARVDPGTGSLTTVSAGNHLSSVSDMAVRGDGTIFVTDRNAGLIRINPTTGAQTVVASNATLHAPEALVLLDNSSAMLSSSGLTQRVNLGTGRATFLSNHTYSAIANFDAGRVAAVEHLTSSEGDPESALIVVEISGDNGGGSRVRTRSTSLRSQRTATFKSPTDSLRWKQSPRQSSA
jgi:hypothetical protein